jgi:ferritin
MIVGENDLVYKGAHFRFTWSMLVSTKTIDAINGQIGMEFAASLQYDAIGAHFDFHSLPRLSQYFYKQSSEEREHAHRFMKFVLDAGAQVVIPAIDAPVSDFKFAKDAVKLSLDQEIKVTQAINGIYDLALKENDHITSTFLHWFIKEQTEEVASMNDLLKTVERAGEGGLLLVEQFLAQGRPGSSLVADMGGPES